MPTKTVTSFSALKHPRANKPNQYHQFWRMICTKSLQGQYQVIFLTLPDKSNSQGIKIIVHGQVLLPVDDYFYSLQGLLSIHKQFYL